MCLQCVTDSVSYGEVMPGWSLQKARKDDPEWPAEHWGLVQCNDPDFVWQTTPEPDPSYGKTDDEINAETKEDREAFTAWLKKVREFDENLVSTPMIGYDLTKAALEAGYVPKEHGNLSYWLFHRLARFTRLQIME